MIFMRLPCSGGRKLEGVEFNGLCGSVICLQLFLGVI